MKSADPTIDPSIVVEEHDGVITLRPVTPRRRTLEEMIAATPSFEGVPDWNDMKDVWPSTRGLCRMRPASSGRGVNAVSLDAGDSVHLDFTPSAGHEKRGPHVALVISRRAFNPASGLVWVCPISQGKGSSAASGFLVTWMGAGTRTVGAVQVHPLRRVDRRARGARRLERAPASLLAEGLDPVAEATGIQA